MYPSSVAEADISPERLNSFFEKKNGYYQVKDEIRKFRRGFLEMGYCLPAAEAVPLAARVLRSALAAPGAADLLAERLRASS